MVIRKTILLTLALAALAAAGAAGAQGTGTRIKQKPQQLGTVEVIGNTTATRDASRVDDEDAANAKPALPTIDAAEWLEADAPAAAE